VVNAILDFTAFDQHVALAAGSECAQALRTVTQLAEKAIQTGGNAKLALKATLQASSLVDDGDFFYFLADSMAEGVQYGYQDELCLPLLYAQSVNQSLIDAYANYTQNTWSRYLGIPDEYATSWQQNTTVDPSKADRQWWFQTCTEFGYFQNAPSVGSIRSQRVNMTYHRTHCQALFGVPLWPDTTATNEYYGSNHTAATRVVFVNGSQDPWQKASVLNDLSISEPALMVTCHNCGHCVDLRECPGGCQNPNAVNQVRAEVAWFVGQCLYEL